MSNYEADYVSDAVSSGWLTQAGKYVSDMENAIAKHILSKNSDRDVTTTSNGTTALHLVLMSIGVKEGDEVIVPDFGYIAPVNAVLMCGATPVVVDVSIDSCCLS